MSETYTDLIYTNFPDNEDTWEDNSDLTADMLAASNQYKQYLESGDLDAANDILSSNPELKKMVITALDINRLKHTTMAIERMWRNDLEKYVKNQVFKEDLMISDFIHTYNSSTRVHNLVGSGTNGRFKVTKGFAAGDTFAVNGTVVPAYVGADNPDADTLPVGKWVSFIYLDGAINFKCGGGVTTSRLAATTALEADTLNGKTFFSKNKTQKIGSMPDNSGFGSTANTDEIACGTSKRIPKGYHDGNGTVVAKSLALQTQGTAWAGAILNGKTAWKDGKKLVGTMPNHGNDIATTLKCGEKSYVPAGYHAGGGYYQGASLASQTHVNYFDPNYLIEGEDVWVNGEHHTGLMPDNGAWNAVATSNGQRIKIPKGRHSGDGKVTVNISGGVHPSNWMPRELGVSDRVNQELPIPNDGAGAYYYVLTMNNYDGNENSYCTFAMGSEYMELKGTDKAVKVAFGIMAWGNTPSCHVSRMGGIDCRMEYIRLT